MFHLDLGPDPYGFFTLLSSDPDNDSVQKVLRGAKMTLQELQSQAIAVHSEGLLLLDNKIAGQLKILQGFQTEFERIKNRQLKHDLLRLQLENLERDLRAIEIDKS